MLALMPTSTVSQTLTSTGSQTLPGPRRPISLTESHPDMRTTARAVVSLVAAASALIPVSFGLRGAAEAAAAEGAASPPGHVILRVDGVPITREELDASVAYRKTYVAGRAEKDLQRAAIDEELILIAAVRAKYASKLPEMKERIDALHAKAKSGAAFADLAREGSECPSSAEGGDLGFFGRTAMTQPFARYAFTLKKGEVSEPFLSVFGYHFITVTDYKKGATAGADEARASHVLVMFDRSPAFRNQIQVMKQAAKVEVVDPAYADVVPEANRKK